MAEYKTILIDDNPQAIGLLKKFLTEFENIEIIGTSKNGKTGLDKCHNLTPDIVFLDIDMPVMTGFEFMEKLNIKPAVIFTTAHTAYALDGYKYSPVDFLGKPISKGRLKDSINKAYEYLELRNGKTFTKDLIIRSKDKFEKIVITKITSDDIDYVEVQQETNDNCTIFLRDGRVILESTRKRLKDYLKELIEYDFFQINRNTVINLKRISGIDGELLTLDSKHEKVFKISRTAKPKIIEYTKGI